MKNLFVKTKLFACCLVLVTMVLGTITVSADTDLLYYHNNFDGAVSYADWEWDIYLNTITNINKAATDPIRNYAMKITDSATKAFESNPPTGSFVLEYRFNATGYSSLQLGTLVGLDNDGPIFATGVNSDSAGIVLTDIDSVGANSLVCSSDTWYSVKHYVDLDKKLSCLYVNDRLICHGNLNNVTLESVNALMFAVTADSDDATSTALYIDDVSIYSVDGLALYFSDNFGNGYDAWSGNGLSCDEVENDKVLEIHRTAEANAPSMAGIKTKDNHMPTNQFVIEYKFMLPAPSIYRLGEMKFYGVAAGVNQIAAMNVDSDNKLTLYNDAIRVETGVTLDNNRWYSVKQIADMPNNKVFFYLDNIKIGEISVPDGEIMYQLNIALEKDATAGSKLYIDDVKMYHDAQRIQTGIDDAPHTPDYIMERFNGAYNFRSRVRLPWNVGNAVLIGILYRNGDIYSMVTDTRTNTLDEELSINNYHHLPNFDSTAEYTWKVFLFDGYDNITPLANCINTTRAAAGN